MTMMRKFLFTAVTVVLFVNVLHAQSSVHAKFGVLFTDRSYAAILEEYVDDQGLVDYKALKNNYPVLQDYIIQIMGLYTDEYEAWDASQKMAFWLNTYNAYTLKSIVDAYPIEKHWKSALYPVGIRHIPGVWDEAEHTVMGRKLTLDHMEHEILRKEFSDPRIHMALVCASRGCPPLRREPYDAQKLDEQLDDQARQFLSQPDTFRINHEKQTVYLSSIFKWFGEDWEKHTKPSEALTWGSDREKAILSFLEPYIPAADWQQLAAQPYQVEFLDYDWSLNEQ